MIRWIDLYRLSSSYESGIFKIGETNFDYLIPQITTEYENNDGKIVVEIRSSLDNGVTWSDWYDVNSGFQEFIFDGNGFTLSEAVFQYRVLFDMLGNETGNSPVFKGFNIDFIGTNRIKNIGDVPCKPELWIKKVNGSGNIKIINETNGQIVELNNLNNNETVYIDCENEDILTDLPLTNRYKDHNDVFLELVEGDNFISGEGDFILDMRFQFKTLQG